MTNVTREVNGYESVTEKEKTFTEISDQLWVYAGLPMLAVGTVGHLLAILVLLGSKRMRLLSLTVYLVAEAVAGLMALHSGLLRQILLNIDGYKNDVREQTSDAGCRVHAALTYFSLQLFSWLQASVAVERVVALRFPLHYKRWCTWKRNLVVVAIVTTVLALCNIIVIFSFHKAESETCSATNEYLFDRVWGIVDLILYAVIPIAVIIPCNVLTTYFMLRSKANRSKNNSSASSRRSSQFTFMLLTQNIVCVLSTLPISIIFLLPWPTEQDHSAKRSMSRLWTIFNLLQYFGSTLGFTVYTILAEKFRKAIQDLFCRGFNADVSLDSVNVSAKSSRRGSKIEIRLLKGSHHSGSSTPTPFIIQETQLDDDLFESQ